MEFNSQLARVQGCLTLAKRLEGPLNQLSVDKNLAAVQTVVEKVKECIADFSEDQFKETNLFLLLNSELLADDEDLIESELGHLIGIAPLISVEVLIVLSVEVISPHTFIYDAMTFLPPERSYQLTAALVSIYFNNHIWKVADNLYLLCLAVYHNILNSQTDKEFHLFSDLLESILVYICEHKSNDNLWVYTGFITAVLHLLKSCLQESMPFDTARWQHIYTRPSVLHTNLDSDIDKVKRKVVNYAEKICSNVPDRLALETNEKSLSRCDSVRELAFECVALFQDHCPMYNTLFDILMSFAKKPVDVMDEIAKCSLPSLCSNSVIESDEQSLWLQALIRHKDGLEDDEALETLHQLMHLFNDDDNNYVCHVFHSSPQSQTDSLRNLAVRCFSRLSLEDKLKMLKCRLTSFENAGFSVTENCELSILEALNRVVAGKGRYHQEEHLIILAYQSPQAVAKHILLVATMNELFSSSVAQRILQSLMTVFAYPAHTTCPGTTLTDKILSEFIFIPNEIYKECRGLQNLVGLLFSEGLLNTEYFLRSCLFPCLFHCVKEHQDRSVILLLEIFMDVQSEVPGWTENLNIATSLIFLGNLIEDFSRKAVFVESQKSMARGVAVRIIDNFFSVPGFLESLQDADKEWMLSELSVLSLANRHYFSAIAPEWNLFYGDRGYQSCVTLALVLPYLHVSEWHQIWKIVPNAKGSYPAEDSFKALAFCSAVNLIVRTGTSTSAINTNLNVASCVRNLGSVIQSHLKSGLEPMHLARIFRELDVVVKYFPTSDQFDLAVFLLPIMFEIVDQGSRDASALSVFSKVVIETSVRCFRRELGRHLKRALTNFMNDNSGIQM